MEPTQPITFERAGVLAGMRGSLPLAVSVFAYGLVFGVLARQAGLSGAEALLMSALVFAGASQLVVLGLWVAPLPVTAIVLAALIVNLRLILLGATLRSWLARLPLRASLASLFFLTDEGWALTLAELRRGSRHGAYLLGTGLTFYTCWLAATLLGHLAGSAVPQPRALGLDFAFTAVFLALLLGFWRGRGDLLPWGCAALVAVAAAHWLPGQWYIVLGGLAGSLVGAWRHAR